MERFSLVLWDASHSLELPLSPTSFVSPSKSVHLSSWISVSTSMFLHLHPFNVFVPQPLSVPSPPLLQQSSPTSKSMAAFVFQPLPALSTCRRPTAANHQLQTGSDIWKMIICCQWLYPAPPCGVSLFCLIMLLSQHRSPLNASSNFLISFEMCSETHQI